MHCNGFFIDTMETYLVYLVKDKLESLERRMDMAVSKTVTCSFTLDRETYDAFKSIVVKNHENVKGNLIRYMKDVIQFETSNAATLAAIKEVEEMKKNPSVGKSYSDVDRMMEDLLA